MKYLLLSLLSVLSLLQVTHANAAELLIIQSKHLPAYDQAVRLIQNSCASGNEPLVISNYSDFDLGRIVREEQPRLVVAIGDQALKKAARLRRVPVVYTMALNVDENSLGENITGVSMTTVPENFLKLFRKLRLQRIGILYDPDRNGTYLKRARQTAAGFGIELVAIKVSSPREVPAALGKLKHSTINGIWMIPDSTAVAAENVDAYFHFAQEQNLPIISFARGYLAKGALAALEVSRQMIGEQSCHLVRKILSGTRPAELADVYFGEATLFTNESVASKLGIKLSGIEQIISSKE